MGREKGKEGKERAQREGKEGGKGRGCPLDPPLP